MAQKIGIAPFVSKDEQRQDGTYPVRIRITFNRKKKEVSTTLSAKPRQLDETLAIRDRALAAETESLVRQLREAADDIPAAELETADIAGVVSAIRRNLSAGPRRPFLLDFPDYFRREADERPANSRQNYMAALHSLCAFVGLEHFDISIVTSSLMQRYERHLRMKYGDAARAVSLYTATVATVHRRAQREFNDEETGDVRIRNPFVHYKPPKQKPSRHRAADASIIRTMLDCRESLSGRPRLGVDVFLLSFALMGMNAPDLYACAPAGKDGVIVYERQKTASRRADRAEMHVRISSPALALAGEYADRTKKRQFGFHLRYSSYRDFSRAVNVGLDAFCKSRGLDKLTLYSARHTWATVAYSAGIDKALINDCLCHVDREMRVTDIYIAKDWSRLWKAAATVLEAVGWR